MKRLFRKSGDQKLTTGIKTKFSFKDGWSKIKATSEKIIQDPNFDKPLNEVFLNFQIK